MTAEVRLGDVRVQEPILPSGQRLKVSARRVCSNRNQRSPSLYQYVKEAAEVCALPFPSHANLTSTRESLVSPFPGDHEVSWLFSTLCRPTGRGVHENLTHPALSGVSLEKEKEKHFKEFGLKEGKKLSPEIKVSFTFYLRTQFT